MTEPFDGSAVDSGMTPTALDRVEEIKAALAFAESTTGDMSDYQTVEGYLDTLAATVRADAIEIAHLREAFVTMEQAYNQAEAALAALRQRHETEITLERDCYAALSSAIVTATGVDVPVGGMTALQAVKALRQRHAEAVKLLADVEWAGTDSVYLTRFCVWCDANEKHRHADNCRYVALMAKARREP